MTDKIKIETIDDNTDTQVTLRCYRETHRLDRLLRVFQKAMTLASAKRMHGLLQDTLFELYDHKGDLTVSWVSPPSKALKRYIEKAWQDEGELKENVNHVIFYREAAQTDTAEASQ